MVAIIELPNGLRAMYSAAGWHCVDKEAIPMLEYFSRKIGYSLEPAHDRAQMVVKSIVGAKFIFFSPYIANPNVDQEKVSRGWKLIPFSYTEHWVKMTGKPWGVWD